MRPHTPLDFTTILPIKNAEELLEDAYGVRGALMPLASERDLIFRVKRVTGGDLVLRVTARREDVSGLKLQCAMLSHALAADPALPLPRPIASIATSMVVTFACGSRSLEAALFSYRTGLPVADVGRSSAQRHAIGVVLARLDKALCDFRWDRKLDVNCWHMSRVPDLLQAARKLPLKASREATIDVMETFGRVTIQALGQLPSQWIHNDFNPRNILVHADRPSEVSGVIDFGDADRAPKIIDLAVAIARQAGLDDPLADACELIAAYNSCWPLQNDEMALLYDLICTRLAMRVTIWHQRLGTDLARLDVATIRETATLLEKWRATGRHAATQRFLEA